MSPSSSFFLRVALSARTMLPSLKETWTSSSFSLRCSTPVFCCWPMSWKMSAMPKSLSVPLSAIPLALLRPYNSTIDFGRIALGSVLGVVSALAPAPARP
jgi:hypothetical protein